MTVEELLTKLEDELENAKDSLFSSKVRVDAKEISSIIAEIRMALPNEILRAKDIIGGKAELYPMRKNRRPKKKERPKRGQAKQLPR